ncbi:MAG: hypothetical protein CL802_07130 [Citromicrobium sp.]|nr:hypothetical protein [Citromicrobium sp.]
MALALSGFSYVTRALVTEVNSLIFRNIAKLTTLHRAWKSAIFPRRQDNLLGRLAEGSIDEMCHDLRDNADQFILLGIRQINVGHTLPIALKFFRRKKRHPRSLSRLKTANSKPRRGFQLL